ncbi:50S ribosomal protein L5p [Candidatus Mancarchaeum acidiphilum]|uniref:50S ribosomal protein L5p n=1 Tax=Candidatus Mancarchaeum acidiphilum TaxID=1920749 RepID=A0A218NLR9_9ARCH|nr:50S ribosomal protein L5 [Candidatus Mancarchaeum acidiphilum]ASI13413.1 50S ribosomal protein L5p [Candidatus Mancarchaeum acidiphilum]
MSDKNSMKDIEIDKVVINIGSGSDSKLQDNAKRLLEKITHMKPADSLSKRRNPTFKISKGTKIGAFVTLRGKNASTLLPKLFEAADNKLKPKAITTNTINFGIREYIDINGIKYDPSIGMLGMNVNVALKRPGFRVADKKIKRGKIREHHKKISNEEITEFVKNKFKVSIGE